MADRPRLLDLFCGAGGAAAGYAWAGFEVTGVDVRPQPRYPFALYQADALEFMAAGLWRPFQAIHASPPCQRFSHAAFCRRHKDRHPDLIRATREALERAGRPWVMENVTAAPMSPFAITLCGLMFGLKVFRHRLFESSHWLAVPEHPSHRGKVIGKDGMCCVVGHGGGVSRRMRAQIARHGRGSQQGKAEWQAAMGIDWMTRNQMSQAIPPAYTEHVGRQLMALLRTEEAKGEESTRAT